MVAHTLEVKVIQNRTIFANKNQMETESERDAD